MCIQWMQLVCLSGIDHAKRPTCWPIWWAQLIVNSTQGFFNRAFVSVINFAHHASICCSGLRSWHREVAGLCSWRLMIMMSCSNCVLLVWPLIALKNCSYRGSTEGDAWERDLELSVAHRGGPWLSFTRTALLVKRKPSGVCQYIPACTSCAPLMERKMCSCDHVTFFTSHSNKQLPNILGAIRPYRRYHCFHFLFFLPVFPLLILNWGWVLYGAWNVWQLFIVICRLLIP